MAAKRITLPGTNLNVSRVCLGCWQFNGGKDTVNWDAQTPEVGVVIAIHRFPSVTRGPQFRCEQVKYERKVMHFNFKGIACLKWKKMRQTFETYRPI